MDWTAAVALLALVKKSVDVVRYLSAKDLNGVVTQVVTWALGVAVVQLVARTVWASQVIVSSIPLTHLNLWSQVFVGLTIGSTSSVVHDAVRAVDNTDSAQVPALLSRSRTPR